MSITGTPNISNTTAYKGKTKHQMYSGSKSEKLLKYFLTQFDISESTAAHIFSDSIKTQKA